MADAELVESDPPKPPPELAWFLELLGFDPDKPLLPEESIAVRATLIDNLALRVEDGLTEGWEEDALEQLERQQEEAIESIDWPAAADRLRAGIISGATARVFSDEVARYVAAESVWILESCAWAPRRLPQRRPRGRRIRSRSGSRGSPGRPERPAEPRLAEAGA